MRVISSHMANQLKVRAWHTTSKHYDASVQVLGHASMGMVHEHGAIRQEHHHHRNLTPQSWYPSQGRCIHYMELLGLQETVFGSARYSAHLAELCWPHNSTHTGVQGQSPVLDHNPNPELFLQERLVSITCDFKRGQLLFRRLHHSNSGNRHLVGGQGSGLVTADDGGAA